MRERAMLFMRDLTHCCFSDFLLLDFHSIDCRQSLPFDYFRLFSLSYAMPLPLIMLIAAAFRHCRHDADAAAAEYCRCRHSLRNIACHCFRFAIARFIFTAFADDFADYAAAATPRFSPSSACRHADEAPPLFSRCRCLRFQMLRQRFIFFTLSAHIFILTLLMLLLLTLQLPPPPLMLSHARRLSATPHDVCCRRRE